PAGERGCHFDLRGDHCDLPRRPRRGAGDLRARRTPSADDRAARSAGAGAIDCFPRPAPGLKPAMHRDFHFPGRSPVIAREGMAATSHPLASLAAIETLRAGGNAADAAITAVAALGVVEPQMTGIGGDCFCLVAKPGAPIWGYNGSGRAGARMRVELLQGAAIVDRDSIHAVTVPGAVYRGEIAQDMVETLAARGSVLTAQDFAEHRGEPMTPIATGYRGLEIYELPPNVQGITALVLLNILENFPLCDLDPLGPERFHLMLEAARLAYALRDAHVADPAFMRVAVADLLDKRLGSELAAKIDPERCLAPPS